MSTDAEVKDELYTTNLEILPEDYIHQISEIDPGSADMLDFTNTQLKSDFSTAVDKKIAPRLEQALSYTGKVLSKKYEGCYGHILKYHDMKSTGQWRSSREGYKSLGVSKKEMLETAVTTSVRAPPDQDLATPPATTVTINAAKGEDVCGAFGQYTPKKTKTYTQSKITNDGTLCLNTQRPMPKLSENPQKGIHDFLTICSCDNCLNNLTEHCYRTMDNIPSPECICTPCQKFFNEEIMTIQI